MTTFHNQEIEARIKISVETSKRFYTMNREEIFNYLAENTALSDQVSNYIREIDNKISEAEEMIHSRHQDCNASMLGKLVKKGTAPLVTERDWCTRQLSLLKDLRISALSAQRSAE